MVVDRGVLHAPGVDGGFGVVKAVKTSGSSAKAWLGGVIDDASNTLRKFYLADDTGAIAIGGKADEAANSAAGGARVAATNSVDVLRDRKSGTANPAIRYYVPGTNGSVGFRVLPKGVAGQGGIKSGPYLRFFGGPNNGLRIPLEAS